VAFDPQTMNLLALVRDTGGATAVVSAGATPTINSDVTGFYIVTAQAAAITNVTVTGNPGNMQKLVIRIKDNGVAKAVAFPAGQFEPVGVALPTTTTAGKRSTWTFYYDSGTSKWGSVSAITEA
jgi:hypothetical protein